MESTLEDKLRSLSKDEESFEELKRIFTELSDEKSRTAKHLGLLERVIENDYDSILITEIDLEAPGPRIVYANEGFTKITGYDREEVIGKTPRILQGPKTDRATLDRLKDRLKNGRAFFGQAINYKKDGTEFVNQWDIHPLTDKEGNLTHWVSYQHDITERKRAEKSVMDTHAEFDELREHSKSTILDVDEEGHILTANKSFRNLTGYAKDELEGKKVWELFPPKYRNSLKGRFDKSELKDQRLKGIIKHKKGFPIQVEGRARVLELNDGTVIRTEIQNISMQKRIMETLQKRNKDYGKIFDKTTQFTYRVVLEEDEPYIEYLSDDFARITGITVEEMRRRGSLDQFVHEDDVDQVRAHLQKAGEGEENTCEYRIRTRDGSYRKVIDYAKPGTATDNGEKPCIRGAVSLLSAEEPA